MCLRDFKDKETIVIFTAEMAKHLLAKGYRIVNLKPHKYEETRTVFVFKNEEGLRESMMEFLNAKGNNMYQ